MSMKVFLKLRSMFFVQVDTGKGRLVVEVAWFGEAFDRVAERQGLGAVVLVTRGVGGSGANRRLVVLLGV
jgi:hypothetical protein